MMIPHPIPYQGSKRKLSPVIASYIQKPIKTLYEPFAGSAAFTLYAAKHGLAENFVIGDILQPLIRLWEMIVNDPYQVSYGYSDVWNGQKKGDFSYYNQIRDQYNVSRNPILLLYLIARCVKNAVRFSLQGYFTQSQDKRRLGTHPLKMRKAIFDASHMLRGRVEFFHGDFEDCLATATRQDLVYMDPPYYGTTYGRDKRYVQQVDKQRLYQVMGSLNTRNVQFILSYDGSHGKKEYTERIPEYLVKKHVLLNAGRSTQATLNGQTVTTYESLYLSLGS